MMKSKQVLQPKAALYNLLLVGVKIVIIPLGKQFINVSYLAKNKFGGND